MEIGGYFIPLIEDIPNTENIEMELPEADQAFVRLRLNRYHNSGAVQGGSVAKPNANYR